jgi:RNA polymerase sigma-70 factor (ECF subfamily)
LQEFGSQVMLHLPRLRRYARALTGERAAADDLVQDTLERACNKLHLWRRGSDLRAWLFTIMHNVFDEIMEVPAHMAQSDRLEIRDLDAALAQLPDEQREVLLLVGLEQLSYDETAKVLRIPIGTVMSRLWRARERLRCIMAGLPEVATLKVVK